MQNMRYQGRLYGGGLSIGHSWILKKRWSLEASIGLGYARILYDKYPCATCGTKLKDTSKIIWVLQSELITYLLN